MRDTAFFCPELFNFLRKLKRNNNREWFTRNKPRYEQVVRDPVLRFIEAFAPELYKISPHFMADPHPSRGSMFRIYRDIRFAADKRPYKTHIGIQFAHEKADDAHAPVFYLHFEPGNCFAAGGVWHPDGPTLTRIRSAVVAQEQEWRKLRKKIGLEGDKLSRPPKGFAPQHPLIEDLKYKDFIASVAFTEAQMCSPKFMRDFVAACKEMKPLVEFTTRAMGLKY
jgi:uncharacterized protein (TIGR02453 family)